MADGRTAHQATLRASPRAGLPRLHCGHSSDLLLCGLQFGHNEPAPSPDYTLSGIQHEQLCGWLSVALVRYCCNLAWKDAYSSQQGHWHPFLSAEKAESQEPWFHCCWGMNGPFQAPGPQLNALPHSYWVRIQHLTFPWASWLVVFNYCFVHGNYFKLGRGNSFLLSLLAEHPRERFAPFSFSMVCPSSSKGWSVCHCQLALPFCWPPQIIEKECSV